MLFCLDKILITSFFISRNIFDILFEDSSKVEGVPMSDSNEIFEQHITIDEFPDDARETSSLQTNLTAFQTDNVLPFNTISKLSDLRSDSELNEILNALKMNSTRDRAAKELGISPRTLRQKLNDFRKAGLPVPGPYART